MKIDFQTTIQASMEQVWKILMDFPGYPEWNSLVPTISGEPALNATLHVTVAPLGLKKRLVAASVTGFVAPKYFSFEDCDAWGRWFFQEEIIFRMKEKEGGVAFVVEAYVTGLSLRFRRHSVEGAYRRAILRLVEALKEKFEGPKTSA